MDGSEDTGSIPAAVLSGAPIELQARTVRYVLQDFVMILFHSNALNKYAASINHPSLPLSPGPGADTTGEWIGTFCPRDTGGKTH